MSASKKKVQWRGSLSTDERVCIGIVVRNTPQLDGYRHGEMVRRVWAGLRMKDADVVFARASNDWASRQAEAGVRVSTSRPPLEDHAEFTLPAVVGAFIKRAFEKMTHLASQIDPQILMAVAEKFGLKPAEARFDELSSAIDLADLGSGFEAVEEESEKT